MGNVRDELSGGLKYGCRRVVEVWYFQPRGLVSEKSRGDWVSKSMESDIDSKRYS